MLSDYLDYWFGHKSFLLLVVALLGSFALSCCAHSLEILNEEASALLKYLVLFLKSSRAMSDVTVLAFSAR